MIRAAAKNHQWCCRSSTPRLRADPRSVARLQGRPKGVDAVLRKHLAAKAFQHVAHYDTAVSSICAATTSRSRTS